MKVTAPDRIASWVELAILGTLAVQIGCSPHKTAEPTGDTAPQHRDTAMNTESPSVTQSQTTQEAVVSKPMEAVKLSNGVIWVEVIPGIGRITGFGEEGGQNLLWRNPGGRAEDGDYVNWGGDKVWPAVQLMWPRFSPSGQWPPPRDIDGAAWKLVESDKRRLVLESPISDLLHIQIRREITLDERLRQLTIRNTITRLQPSPFPVTLWAITQVQRPEYGLMSLAPDRPDAQKSGWIWLFEPWNPPSVVHEIDGGIALDPPKDGGLKIGAYGRTVAAVYDEVVLVQHTEFDAHGAYPDGSSVQLYVDQRYVELETLSPTVHLQPGESLQSSTRWLLIDRPRGDTVEVLKAISAEP